MTVDDPDFEAKLQAALLRQMTATEHNGEAAI